MALADTRKRTQRTNDVSAANPNSNLDPLAEVALAAGFADQSHFTRVFKQVTGMTPGAFRSALSRG